MAIVVVVVVVVLTLKTFTKFIGKTRQQICLQRRGALISIAVNQSNQPNRASSDPDKSDQSAPADDPGMSERLQLTIP